MKGSIVKKGDKYCIVIYLGLDRYGKKKQKWFSGYESKKEAEKALPRILVQLEDGDLINESNKKLSNFATEWLEIKKTKDNLAATTYSGYKNIINKHIVPNIGHLKLKDIKTYHLQRYVDDKFYGKCADKSKLSALTLSNHKRVLSSMFCYALDMDLIQKNPVIKVKLPRELKKEVNPYDLNESRVLLDLIQSDRYLCIPVTLAVLLGLRRGECLGLSWDDIDFKNNIISITKNLEFVEGTYYLKDPKTINSKRSISVPDILIDYLREHQNWQREMKLRSGYKWVNSNNLVCVNPKNGNMINPTRLSDKFKWFLEDNNLRHIKFHDLRHTNASLMLAADVSAKVAQMRLGHSNVSITLDLYSHVLTSVDMEAASKIDNLFVKTN